MIQRVLLFSLLTGIFPYRFYNNHKVLLQFSKLGLSTNLLSCGFLFHQIRVLFTLIIEAIKDASPAADIKLAIKITNVSFLLIITIRRFIRVKIEAEILNEMFNKMIFANKTWRGNYTQVVVVFVVGLCEIAIEYGIFLYIRVSEGDTLYTYDLTLLIRLGFEIQIITVLSTEHRLYEFFNNIIRFEAPKNALSLHNLRLQMENLHKMRVRLNDCYSLDLLFYFVGTQLIMLLECFDSVKLFSAEDYNLRVFEMVMRGLRIFRLFAMLAYIIWRWCVVSYDCRKTIEYLFEYDVNKLSHQTVFQLELFFEDIRTRNKLFSTHKLYDINMPLFYNISGTIFAYLMLLTTSSAVQQ